jgi:archaellum component FlaG (FlaF/FlaG flagellin family)
LVVEAVSFLAFVLVVAEAAAALTDMARTGWVAEIVSTERKAERLNMALCVVS